ncbi:MAG: HD domain-containing protein, partial [Gallionellaceae bacterium]|nr:HD domain-containing protein [Gallionellaceae bacterium]
TRLEIIHGLARAAEYRDNETGFHIIRMSSYVKLLAIKSGVEESEAEKIRYASMMHDTGKIGTPDHILLKPGKLTDDELAIMKKHPQIGAKIIGEHDSALLEYARIIALTHHEKWNGTGYPNGLKGEEIPLAGRLTAIADVFDALTSVRPYKLAWSMNDALDFIRKQAGESFDPRLAFLFVELRPEIKEIMLQYHD